MTNKTHKDNPKFYSGYMSEVEALFSILRDYNLVIQDALVTFTNAFFLCPAVR